MGFFSEPAFFLLLVPVAGIAIVLGWLEKPLARYGLVASVAMLLLLFSRSLPSLAFFLCYSFHYTLAALTRFIRAGKHVMITLISLCRNNDIFI